MCTNAMADDPQIGQVVRDRISGFEGVVTTLGRHISGCTRYGVHPSDTDDSTFRGDEEFFYGNQLEVVEEETDFTEEYKREDVDFELGEHVRDTVSEVEGLVIVINHKLYNCPQVCVQPKNQEAKEDVAWVDHMRLKGVGTGVSSQFSHLQEKEESKTGSSHDAADPNHSANRR